MRLDIINKKEDIIPLQLVGKSVVVIDVLRATSTIVAAFENGCREVIAVATPQEASNIKNRLGVQGVLGGERKKQKLPGFDFGNSPREYTLERLSGKTLVFTTTNGTALINSCIFGKEILIASFRNAEAVVGCLKNNWEVLLACAGTKGTFSLEDNLLAGYLSLLVSKKYPDSLLSEKCKNAIKLFKMLEKDIPGILEKTPHGHGLALLGLEKDISYCLEKNKAPLVPKVKTRVFYPRIQL